MGLSTSASNRNFSTEVLRRRRLVAHEVPRALTTRPLLHTPFPVGKYYATRPLRQRRLFVEDEEAIVAAWSRGNPYLAGRNVRKNGARYVCEEAFGVTNLTLLFGETVRYFFLPVQNM